MTERVVIITGPTAAGKTAVALELGRRFSLEVVSADSRQVYRKMDIGTGKPLPDERNLLPHHLLDIIDPDERYSAYRFFRQAEDCIATILKKGKFPIVVGGTGLYIKVLTEGIFATGRLLDTGQGRKYCGWPLERLRERLRDIDPEAWESIDRSNPRRVARAIEVKEQTGESIVQLRKKNVQPAWKYVCFCLEPEREELRRRAEERVGRMFGSGLIEETETLIRTGYGEGLESMSGIGYREVCRFLKGEISRAAAEEQTKRRTRQYQKRQRTWFHHQHRNIEFFPSKEKILSAISYYLEKGAQS